MPPQFGIEAVESSQSFNFQGDVISPLFGVRETSALRCDTNQRDKILAQPRISHDCGLNDGRHGRRYHRNQPCAPGGPWEDNLGIRFDQLADPLRRGVIDGDWTGRKPEATVPWKLQPGQYPWSSLVG